MDEDRTGVGRVTGRRAGRFEENVIEGNLVHEC